MIVTVVWATSRLQDVVTVQLTPGATIADAIGRSGFLAQYGLDPATLGYARYGIRAAADTRLAEGDRVEITRGLVVDPEVARARRARAKASTARAPRGGRDRSR